MASTTTISTSLLPSRAFRRNQAVAVRKRFVPVRKMISISSCMMRRRGAHDEEEGRNTVDEGMLILRMRIHEMKLAERNYEPPPEWMWWEKQLYADYDAFICDLMGMLQSRLMETRPAAVLAWSAILALSLPLSAATVMFHVARMLTAGGGGGHVIP